MRVSCKDNCYFSYLFQNKLLARIIVTLIPARHEVKEARRGRLVPAHTRNDPMLDAWYARDKCL